MCENLRLDTTRLDKIGSRKRDVEEEPQRETAALIFGVPAPLVPELSLRQSRARLCRYRFRRGLSGSLRQDSSSDPRQLIDERAAYGQDRVEVTLVAYKAGAD